MRDRVTISLYSVETNEEPGYTKGILNEISNVEKIYHGLVNAATRARCEPPQFIVSILLIPEWGRENNSYENDLYLERKKYFLEEIKNRFKHIVPIKVEDFYLEGKLDNFEKKYMLNLHAKGSTADMIKTRAIINNLNRRHLQIDSNTIVPSFNELYMKTFNAAEQKDGVNASYYDEFYISAHNKMVYTTPTGFIAQSSKLETHLLDWCKAHCDDNNIDQDKHKDKNSIYAKVFTKALLQIEYVKKFTLKDKIIYAATLDNRVYWLTNCMVTAVNQSWSASGFKTNEKLIQLPKIKIGDDGLFNYQCLINIVKKHTGNLRVHSRALGLNDSSISGEVARKLLLSLSNTKQELQATKQFIFNSIQNSPQITSELLEIFRDNENTNILTKELFDCSVIELPQKIKLDSQYIVEETDLDKDEKATNRPAF